MGEQKYADLHIFADIKLRVDVGLQRWCVDVWAIEVV